MIVREDILRVNVTTSILAGINNKNGFIHLCYVIMILFLNEAK